MTGALIGVALGVVLCAFAVWLGMRERRFARSDDLARMAARPSKSWGAEPPVLDLGAFARALEGER